MYAHELSTPEAKRLSRDIFYHSCRQTGMLLMWSAYVTGDDPDDLFIGLLLNQVYSGMESIDAESNRFEIDEEEIYGTLESLIKAGADLERTLAPVLEEE